MKRHAWLSVVLLAALCVASCAKIREDWEAVHAAITSAADAVVEPKVVEVAAETFDATEVLATNYLRLKRCTPAIRPICREPSMTPVIKGAIISGRDARNRLEAFLEQHPGALGSQGLVDALKLATETIRNATAAWRAATGRA